MEACAVLGSEDLINEIRRRLQEAAYAEKESRLERRVEDDDSVG